MNLNLRLFSSCLKLQPVSTCDITTWLRHQGWIFSRLPAGGAPCSRLWNCAGTVSALRVEHVFSPPDAPCARSLQAADKLFTWLESGTAVGLLQTQTLGFYIHLRRQTASWRSANWRELLTRHKKLISSQIWVFRPRGRSRLTIGHLVLLCWGG